VKMVVSVRRRRVVLAAMVSVGVHTVLLMCGFEVRDLGFWRCAWRLAPNIFHRSILRTYER
jgi:hypothetical protein